MGNSARRAGMRAAAVVTAALTLLPSCSMFFVQGPPPEPLWQRIPNAPCTTSRMLPVFDGLMAATQLTYGLQYSPNADGTGGASSRDDAVAVGLGVLLWASSALIGFSRTARCDAYLEFRSRQQWQSPPQGWEPPAGTPAAPPALAPRPPSVPPPGQPDDPGDAPPRDDAFPPPAGPPPQAGAAAAAAGAAVAKR